MWPLGWRLPLGISVIYSLELQDMIALGSFRFQIYVNVLSVLKVAYQ